METLTNLKGNLEKFQERDSAHRRNDTLKKTSSLYKLDPFVDKNGLLRIGGRIRWADVSLEVKHLLILPKKSHISDLIVRYFQESVGHHQGRGVTHNTIRQAGYWIVDGRSTVARTISQCVTCRRFHGQLQTQKMSDLLDALQELNRDRVKGFLLTKECDWIDFSLNVPVASHMGGSWERLIRTVRSVLIEFFRW